MNTEILNNILNTPENRIIECDCGKKFFKNNIKIHSVSKRHVDFLNSGVVKPIIKKKNLTEEEKKERKNQRIQKKIDRLIEKIV
jgi:hypothetical protein